MILMYFFLPCLICYDCDNHVGSLNVSNLVIMSSTHSVVRERHETPSYLVSGYVIHLLGAPFSDSQQWNRYNSVSLLPKS